jgi:hypothetical protein
MCVCVFLMRIITQYNTTQRSWSLQQKLFAGNDSTSDLYSVNKVYMDKLNTLISTVSSSAGSGTASYIFKTFGSGWSLQQKLTAFTAEQTNFTTFNKSDPIYDGAIDRNVFPSSTPSETARAALENNFGNPHLMGSNLVHWAGPAGGVQIRSQYRNGSCLQIWMSDHFLDGWDTAVLTVRAPDLTNDTFHPHCDEVSWRLVC